MGSVKSKDIHFPLGGLEKKVSYRLQKPYTTPDCLNVRPDGTLEGRERGGSRPGLGKAYDTKCGPGFPYVLPITLGDTPVRLLNSVTVTKEDGFRFWIDAFGEDSLGDMWTQAPWLENAPDPFPDDTDDLVYEEENGAVLDALTDFDITEPYSVEIFISPWESDADTGEAHHGQYHLYAAMSDSSPDVRVHGIEAVLTITGTGKTYDVELLVDGTSVATSSGSWTGSLSGWFTMLVDVTADELPLTLPAQLGGVNVKLYWQNAEIVDQSFDATIVGSRVGFGMTCTTEGGICLVEFFRVQYYVDLVQHRYRTLLIASANKQLYVESMLGKLTEVTGQDMDINDDRQIASAERGQKLYIADHGEPRVDGEDSDLEDSVLTDEDVDDWTIYGIDPEGDVCVITDGQGSVTDGVYPISSVDADGITLATDPGDGTCSFRIERGPKIFDPSDSSLSLWTATSGSVPPGCSLITLYRDRLVLAGDKYDPHNWYMSAQGDPLNWDYAADSTDVGRAVAGNNTEAGRIGEPVTALITVQDDYLIMGGTHSLWVMRGDAAYDGQIDKLSDIAGVVSGDSWCLGPDGEVIFLSLHGLYVVSPGAEPYPTEFSSERLPRELIDIDRDNVTVTMAYDVRYHGFHLYLTQNDRNADQKHWWFDWSTKSFWPAKLQGDHEPFALHYHKSEASKEGIVLLGCRDGWIRCYRDEYSDDDGTPISSHVLYGPMRIAGNSYQSGQLLELQGVLAEDSKAVTWEVITGNTHEKVLRNSYSKTGTWNGGLNYMVRPMCIDGSMGIMLSSTKQWAVEYIKALIKPIGPQRKL